jgi:hypothetical protein
MKEVWKEIEGYEGIYQISESGKVKSLERYVDGRWGPILIKEKILSPITAGKRYKMVGLSKNSKTKFVNIHRLLAQTFINNPNNKLQVNHIDGNKMNNDLLNLEWVTPKENIRHAWDNNLCENTRIANSNRMKNLHKTKNKCLKNYQIESN